MYFILSLLSFHFGGYSRHFRNCNNNQPNNNIVTHSDHTSTNSQYYQNNKPVLKCFSYPWFPWLKGFSYPWFPWLKGSVAKLFQKKKNQKISVMICH